jgi:hypothetical protein
MKYRSNAIQTKNETKSIVKTIAQKDDTITIEYVSEKEATRQCKFLETFYSL